MDLSYSPEELAFRNEVRDWLSANLPQDIRDKVVGYQHLSRDDIMRWHRILAKKGWSVPHWPVEWGGTGWDITQRYIFNEEFGLAGAPTLPGFGPNMCASVLLRFGTDAQKNRHLPRIRDGEEGLLVDYGDVEQLAAAIAVLHGDPERLAEMGANAKRRFEADYRFPSFVRHWQALLSEVAA